MESSTESSTGRNKQKMNKKINLSFFDLSFMPWFLGNRTLRMVACREGGSEGASVTIRANEAYRNRSRSRNWQLTFHFHCILLIDHKGTFKSIYSLSSCFTLPWNFLFSCCMSSECSWIICKLRSLALSDLSMNVCFKKKWRSYKFLQIIDIDLLFPRN